MNRSFLARSYAGILSIPVLALFVTCTGPSDLTDRLSENLEVTWELLGNSFGENETCRAAFTFVNKGPVTIRNRDWDLYFSQNTVRPHPPDDSALGWVERINGDFYRFVPGEAFRLSPGDSLVVTYSSSGIMIKEADGPNGVYVALRNSVDNGFPRLLRHYSVKPFVPVEKLFPGFSQMIPTPESEYIRNASLAKLPLENTGKFIPTPFRMIPGTGRVTVSETTVIRYTSDVRAEAEYLGAMVQALFGGRLIAREGIGEEKDAIILKTSDIRVNGVGKDAYHLQILQGKGITITGSDAAGVFYGIQSLLALVPPDYLTRPVSSVTFDAVEIHDAPRFPFRSFLLDVARNFQHKGAVLKMIDLLAFYKINALNLRLTDDEGWRLEIAGLPELTEVGSRRGHTLDDTDWLQPSFGSGPFPDSANNMGSGYFTREDFKEILRYAHQRHIEVIPEICFPSHARAAIKAMEARYRKFMQQGDEKAASEFRLIDPDDRSVYLSAQLYKDNIVCVALESTYHFYETVVKDLMAMYQEAGIQLKRFHTGGDEVPRGAWSGSPLCLKLLAEHPEIKEPRNLQGYFFNRALEMLAPYDLIIGGWEEVVLNKDAADNISVNPAFVGRNVIPYVWDNTGSNVDLGYRIANAGYPVVLCNVTNLYFDLSYNPDPTEPGLYWGGFQDTKDPFVLMPYDVFKSAVYDEFGNAAEKEKDFSRKVHLKPESRKNIIGLQAQLWSETLKRPDMMEYYMLPKLFAFAERAWAAAPRWETEPDLKSRTQKIDAAWNEFANRIGQRELPRLEYLFGGFNYRIPLPGAKVENGILQANIAYPGFTIRFTTDGTEPAGYSRSYNEPVEVTGTVMLRAFSASGRAGRCVKLP